MTLFCSTSDSNIVFTYFRCKCLLFSPPLAPPPCFISPSRPLLPPTPPPGLWVCAPGHYPDCNRCINKVELKLTALSHWKEQAQTEFKACCGVVQSLSTDFTETRCPYAHPQAPGARRRRGPDLSTRIAPPLFIPPPKYGSAPRDAAAWPAPAFPSRPAGVMRRDAEVTSA